MDTEILPRQFGNYLLTAALGRDALGRVYRALRREGDRGFARLRILEAPELSNDALLDAIEQNGEIHGFLKNPAVARGVDMDSVDGTPYIAWNEPSGRTLDVLLEKCRAINRRVPVEHALLIAEKIATALDHAYNTTVDGDRTLHGLVWPALVVISDDGEIRLSGFGLAEGVLPSIAKPRLAAEVAPYLAPEERETGAVGQNSDVFSVGAVLWALLAGEAPPPDAIPVLKGQGSVAAPPVLPEIQTLLRMTLSGADARYKSSGDLRRELGKLLFSGPYSPSTFNLAYFLNDLFREEIEREGRARAREATLDGTRPGAAPPAERPAPPPRPPAPPAEPAKPRTVTAPRLHVEEPSRRGRPAALLAVVAAAAVAGGVYVLVRRPEAARLAATQRPVVTARPTPTLLPELQATPAGPTADMTEAQFREEVSRRLAAEVPKLEAQMRDRERAAAIAPASGSSEPRAAAPTRAPYPTAAPTAPMSAPVAIAAAAPPPPERRAPAPEEPAHEAPAPTAVPTSPPAVVAVAERSAPSAAPVPTRVHEGALVAFDELDSPPRLVGVVKPAYPPLALKARLGGLVLLRVLVSEKGAPQQVDVVRRAPAGLTESAVEAVRKWTFAPATKGGVPVKTWMTVPIPFEP
jgi:TonB family protein